MDGMADFSPHYNRPSSVCLFSECSFVRYFNPAITNIFLDNVHPTDFPTPESSIKKTPRSENIEFSLAIRHEIW
jgi:hypothetical protein